MCIRDRLYPLSQGKLTAGMFIALVSAALELIQLMSWQLARLTEQMAKNKAYMDDLTEFVGLSEDDGALKEKNACPDAVSYTHLAKKHSVMVKPRKERVRDSVEVRSVFFCAFRAFPASSPSVPNSRERTGECFFFFSCSPPVPRMASRGVIRLSFRAEMCIRDRCGNVYHLWLPCI